MHSSPLKNSGQVRYWALIVSAVIHVIALGVFAGIKLSGISEPPRAQRSTVSMETIQKAVETPKPKPKVEPISKVEPEKTPLVAAEETPVEPEPVPAMAEAVPDIAEIMPAEPVNEVEFFGQKSIVQRICYVVDCSGSMYGQMYRVKKQLKQSILNLNSGQAFTVLFFMDGQQILMTGSGTLTPATTKAKSEAVKLIDQVRPGGSTDAMHALECAMRLRCPEGQSPEVVYFLTDGFNLDQSGADLFVAKVDRLRKSLAPSTVMHTIGFWPEKTDRRMLKALANKSGGSYIEGIKQ